MPQKRRNEDEVDVALEPFRRLMASGMPDADVAKRTGIPQRSVQRWRLKNGIKQSTTSSQVFKTVQAVSAFGEILTDLKQRTAHSSVLGAWEPPAFVTREHLNYDLFLLVLDAAHRVLDLSEEDIAKGMGITPSSVTQGLAIYNQHRLASGKVCLTCQAPLDPNQSANPFCTKLCERLHVHR